MRASGYPEKSIRGVVSSLGPLVAELSEIDAPWLAHFADPSYLIMLIICDRYGRQFKLFKDIQYSYKIEQGTYLFSFLSFWLAVSGRSSVGR